MTQLQTLPAIAQTVSIALFAWYGIGCFVSQKMITEFERYRLPQFRALTGTLQIAGAVGEITGYFNRPILLFSAVGLALMMLLGVLTRFRIRDPLYAAIPAFTLCALNVYIFAAAL